ncbi:MAG: DegT/DnrJ/EryC1/StrS family aminotransferase [Actinomycetaceae bacterium]|nr:DegT/DnrJ/EryC1/StrS family aminotransferase [Actinomycetaceae bacterium]MDO5747025.1 DegT/DnrJ/EryC1/StrS family aminotransferase [Actinomycetaceae bacterium]
MSLPEHVPFFRPDITEEEVQAVVTALRSGWLTTGGVCAQFEKDFQEYLGDDSLHCIAVNSATAALHLSVEALGIGPGDEVLVPTWTFTSTAEVVRYMGATPVLVDIDPDTFFIDFADAERKITENTKAIIPVHFAGLPIPRGALNRFAADHSLHVIEDAAHCFPVMNEGGLVGRLFPEGDSDAVCFSFYATKTMTTGEGGMVVTRDNALAQRMKAMRLHGISRDVFDRYTAKGASWFYEVIAPGFKYNLTDTAAALGRVQLTRAKAMAERRGEVAKQYLEAFADLPVALPVQGDSEHGHAWHLFVIQILSEAHLGRDEFIERAAEAGISCSVHFIPLHLHPYYRDKYGYKAQDLPYAAANYQQAVSLPIFSAQTDADTQKVITVVRELLG